MTPDELKMMEKQRVGTGQGGFVSAEPSPLQILLQSAHQLFSRVETAYALHNHPDNVMVVGLAPVLTHLPASSL